MQVNKVYMAMFGGVPAKPTGLAMSVLRRAEAFAEAGIRTEILVDHYSTDFDEHARALETQGRVGGKITLRYMHYDLADQEVDRVEDQYVSPLGVDGWSYTPLNGRDDALIGKLDGEYSHRVLLREGQVLFIDNVRGGWDRRDWFDTKGRLCRTDHMGTSGKPTTIRYLDRVGRCYLAEYRDELSQRTLRFEHYPKSGEVVVCESAVDVFHYWMRMHVLPGASTPTIISEYGVRRKALQSLETEFGARVLYTVHSNHLSGPHKYGAPVRPEMVDLFAHIKEYRGLVVLTDEQRYDIWKEFGRDSPVSVIPHYVSLPQREVERDQKKVVMVGRFHAMKGQLAAIRAFKRVASAVPDARLVFYGRGGEEEAMRREIEALNLQDAVTIAGFTSDASEVFLGAGMSIVASDYEGFCLSAAESMAAGCVPVSYDIKYGPSEMIVNGVSGFLVEHGNEREMADALILGLSNPSYLSDMSMESVKIAERFSKERFLQDWHELLNR